MKIKLAYRGSIFHRPGFICRTKVAPRLVEAEFKKDFLRGVDQYSGFCLRLAPKVRLPSDSENDRERLIAHVVAKFGI